MTAGRGALGLCHADIHFASPFVHSTFLKSYALTRRITRISWNYSGPYKSVAWNRQGRKTRLYHVTHYTAYTLREIDSEKIKSLRNCLWNNFFIILQHACLSSWWTTYTRARRLFAELTQCNEKQSFLREDVKNAGKRNCDKLIFLCGFIIKRIPLAVYRHTLPFFILEKEEIN